MNNLFSAVLPALFQAVLVMSLTAAVTALAVMAIRAVMGALRVPRAIVFLLWAVVLFRMMCPVSFSSSWSLLSLFPAAEEQAADLPGGDMGGGQAVWNGPQEPGNYQTGASGGEPAPTLAPETDSSAQSAAVSEPATPPASAEPNWLSVLSAVWALGVLALWLWSLLSWLRLRRRLSAAVRAPDGAWESDRVDSPFVLGFFPPKIYLPLGLSGDTRRYVLLHERAHIRRGDHIVKVLAFLALAVHWFNPLLWLSWFLSCRDMEAACDEAVLRRSPEDIRKHYSAALLSLAAAHPLRVPLAFGENGVKGRVRGALRWKRPAAALVAVALVVLLASCYMLAANPAQVPDAAPELTVTVEGSSAALASGADAPDWDSTPLFTGPVAASVELSFSDSPPDTLEAEDLLLSAGGAPSQSLDVSLNTDGSAAFLLHSHEASTGTGTELRGIAVTARWGSGVRTLTVRYTFRVRLPATQIGVDREAPAVVAGGQELSLRNSSPFASLQNTQPLILTHRDTLISLSHPTDAVGYTVELYALNESTCTETGDPLNQLNVQSVDGNANLASGTAFYLSEDAPGGLLGLRLTYQYPSGVARSWIGLLELDGGAQAPECVFTEEGLPYLRYPGEEDLTPLLPLLPAPAEWAEQDMGGRNEAETLANLGYAKVQMGFTTASEGWAVVGVGAGVGNADTYFYRTHDGGHTWTEYSHPDSQWYMERAAFSDPDHGVLCEGLFVDAPIYVTLDGGETWRELEISQIYDQAYPEDIPDDALYTVDSLLLCGSWGVLTLSGYSLPPLCVYTQDNWDTFSLIWRGVLPVGDEAAYEACALELDEYGTPVLSLDLLDSEDFSTGTVTLWWDGGAWYRGVDIGDPAELTAADLPDPDNLYVNGIPRSFDDPDVWETSPIRILGDLPEGDVTLYGLNETLTGRSGLLLRQGERVAYYPDLTYNAGPRIIHAGLALADYDGDGAEELAAVVSAGTGTGVSAWDLHIFQLQGGGLGQVSSLSWEDLGQAANAQLTSSARREGDTALLTITWPKGQVECDITGLTDPSEALSELRAEAGWINAFDLSAVPIRASCELMVRNTLGYAASYAAALSFDGSAFRLDPGSSTLTLYPDVLPDTPVTTWAEDTGNYAAEHTPTRSEILAEYGFDWGDMYYVYCTPLDDTLHLQLWFDPETGRGCGFRYVWEGGDGPLAVPDIYAFGLHGATVPTEWDDPYTCGLLGNADAYSVLTPWGTDGSEAVSSLRSDWSYRAGGNPEAFHAAGTDESGNPVDVLDVTFSYWDDGPLLSKSYFHNQLLFGTAYFSTQMYYTSHERLAYARCYLTHGSLELFYFYDGDGDTPAYCLMLDNDGGFCFPTLFAY